MNGLLGYNNIICAPSFRDKSNLVRRDDVIQVRSNPGNNQFSDDLVYRVTKAYRSIIT